jgi:Bacterial protein of unknown function (DUF839)
MSRRTKVAAALAAVAALSAAPAIGAQTDDTSRGPSTTTDPYLLPVADGVSMTSLLTVDDAGSADNGYEMAGIPDGIGAFQARGRSFSMLMNHELRDTTGIARRHGQRGAFVSRLKIDRRTLAVTEGVDHIDPGVTYWDYPSQQYRNVPSTAGPNPRNPGDAFLAQPAAFSRFCSSTLSEPGQLFNRRSRRGYDGQLYFANEENGDEGRLFGITETGTAKQLPRLGLFNWENAKPAFNRGDRTVVMGNEDAAGGQLWVYSGVKRRRGDAFERAGLTNGSSFVLDAVDQAVASDAQWRASYPKGTPGEVGINAVDWDQSGAAQNREAAADGLTLNRIEDGDFDPENPNDFYFVTTEGGGKEADPTDPRNSVRDGGGLWKLSFEDVNNPELGGTLTLVLDGTEAPYLNKPDNTTIDSRGNLLIQEDPGGNDHVARIVAYELDSGRLGVVAQFDPRLFAVGGSDFITRDEESSGIVEARNQLGRGVYLLDAQVHAPPVNNQAEYVERGQLLVMEVDSWRAVYGDDD